MLRMGNCVFIHPINLYSYHKKILLSKRYSHGYLSKPISAYSSNNNKLEFR
jgi:hypothetical protein